MQFIRERLSRLGVPFIFGVLVLAPPQVYVERLTTGKFTGSFPAFIPHYFEGFYAFGGNFAWMGLHLWYLGMLLVFSVMMLPLFRFLKSPGASNFNKGMSVFMEKAGSIYLFFIPIVVAEMLVNLQPKGIGIRDFGGWSPLSYLVFFVVGYMTASVNSFADSAARMKLISSGLALAATITGYVFLTCGGSDRSALFSIIRSFNSWCWLCAIIGFGKTFLDFSNNFLNHANEAVLPFYVLHQTIIVITAYFLINLDIEILLKYLILILTSFVVIIMIYELLIRKIGILRLLFGMKST